MIAPRALLLLLLGVALLACEPIDLGGNIRSNHAARPISVGARDDAAVSPAKDATPLGPTEHETGPRKALDEAGTGAPHRDSGRYDSAVNETRAPDAAASAPFPSNGTVRDASSPSTEPPSIATSLTDSGSPAAAFDASTCVASRFVEGSVRTPRGLPLANVELQLSTASSRLVASAATDVNGKYRLGPVCEGAYSLEPTLAGYAFCLPNATFTLQHGDLWEDFTASSAGCETPTIVRSVQAYVFDPDVDFGDAGRVRLSTKLGVEAPEQSLKQLIRYLEMASNGHVHFELTVDRLNEFPVNVDGKQFTQDSYFACHTGEACAGIPADDSAITQALNACEAIDAGAADEIWLLGAPNFGFYPRFELVPTCRRSADIVPLTYGLGLERLLADFQWRSQNGLETIFGSISPDVPVTPLDVFTHDAFTGRNGATAAGCGSSVFAPNATAFNVFDDPRSVPAYCDAFYDYPPTPDPLVATHSLSCADWGCTELGFRRYWFMHLPRTEGRDAEGRLADFWPYILDPDVRTSTTGLVCSSALGTGWCDYLLDGNFGTCNEGEWASINRGPTWVDVYLGQEVSSVALFDRACIEQVLSGHLEFSDGSAPVYFGALPDDGLSPLRVTFTPRVVRSLRIVIDETSGPYPGLGEIQID